jgi:O-antigen/teichoic acid export membrane protein
MTKVGRIQIIIIGFIVSGIVLFGKDFILLWVGDNFEYSYYCAVFIIIPSFFHLPQEIAHQTVYVLNKVKLEAVVFLLMALLNIIGASAFAPNLAQ